MSRRTEGARLRPSPRGPGLSQRGLRLMVCGGAGNQRGASTQGLRLHRRRDADGLHPDQSRHEGRPSPHRGHLDDHRHHRRDPPAVIVDTSWMGTYSLTKNDTYQRTFCVGYEDLFIMTSVMGSGTGTQQFIISPTTRIRTVAYIPPTPRNVIN